ncbi:hypothetical protein GCM10023311_02500 [Flaviramulus aquimarinus]|uniref:GtrA-like protein n=1 Tax=Flaviramulus aquimarinus TaxID=1170456 RepID=A0ABP9EUJ9_9FLAO
MSTMNVIKELLSQISKKLVSKYILISLLSYIYVFISLYVLVDIFSFNKKISFIVVYAIAYILLYGVQLKFLFSKRHDNYKLIKYCCSILFFYICANMLYNLGLYLEINYIVSTAITIVILMPLRLIMYTFFVYKD